MFSPDNVRTVQYITANTFHYHAAAKQDTQDI